MTFLEMKSNEFPSFIHESLMIHSQILTSDGQFDGNIIKKIFENNMA